MAVLSNKCLNKRNIFNYITPNAICFIRLTDKLQAEMKIRVAYKK